MTEAALLGHNGGPEIDGRKPTLRTIWAHALFDDPTTPSHVMAIAWAIHWYSRKDGTGAALSNEQLMHICGVSEDTCTKGKKWLRDHGYVVIRVGDGRTKTQFSMRIPTEEERAASLAEWNASKNKQGRVRPQRTLEGPPTADRGVGDERIQGPLTPDPGSAVPADVIRTCIPDTIPEGQHASRGRSKGGSSNFWNQALNPPELHGPDVLFENGRLTLVNGTRSRWLIEFADDIKRLDLALVQVAALIQPNSGRPIAVQVEGHLARIAAEKHDRDRRYQSAAAANRPGKAAGSSSGADGLTEQQRRLRAAVGPERYDAMRKGKPDA